MLSRYIKNTFSVVVVLGAISFALPAMADDDGSQIMQKNNCASCHNLTGPSPSTLKEVWDRKGPDLFYAGNKYKKEWIEAWLQKPAIIRPSGMYYGNNIKPGPKHDVVDESKIKPHMALSKKDAHEVAESLMKLTAKSELIKLGDFDKRTISTMMGEMAFDKFTGCMACHQIEPGYGGLSGPEVYTAANRLQDDYMMSFIRNPQAWDPKSMMPNKHISEENIQKIVAYLKALSAEGGNK